MMDAVLMPVIFTLLFVYVFGGSIGQALGGGQAAYVQYVIPGMIAMMSMNIAQGVGTGFNEDFNKGIMDRFRSLPIGRGSVLIAKISVELVRLLVAVTIQMIVALLVGFDINGHWGGLLAAIGLTALFGSAIMWIFLVLGVTMKNAQSVQAMGFLVMMPLQFGSSIFAPTSSMPGWLENFTKYNPMSGLADAARGLMTGGPIAHGLTVTLAWTAGLTLTMAPIAIRKFTKKS
jgi:oleandomycin transport system permease protein